jgi:hypothetical protein
MRRVNPDLGTEANARAWGRSDAQAALTNAAAHEFANRLKSPEIRAAYLQAYRQETERLDRLEADLQAFTDSYNRRVGNVEA